MSSMNADEIRNIRNTEESFWWFRGMRAILWPWLDHILIRFHEPRVAELGCGTGGFASHFTKRYNLPVVAMDLEPLGLRYAHELGLNQLVCGDIQAVPLASESMDLVLSLDVIIHLDRGKEDVALEEFCRVLKPGGVLLLRVAALDELHSRHSQYTWEKQRFTKARLQAALERAGFSIERIGYFNSLLLPIAWFKFRVWEPLTDAKPSSGLTPLPGWLNELLCIPLWIESLCSKMGWTFPLGQSLICTATKSFGLEAGQPKLYRPRPEDS
jgi:SAM-dependent methyltransferase